MSNFCTFILPATLVLGLTAPFAVSAQQPDPPPPQAESGWRKFSDARPAAERLAADREAPRTEAPPAVLPGQLVMPAGTWITIRINEVISTDHNLGGDAFAATLAQPLIADGIVLARRGQTAAGRVVEVVKGGRIKGTSRLGLELTELSLVDGRQVPVRTQLVNYSGGASRGRDATGVAVTTGTGAAIGAAAGGGLGAGIGALAGAAASTIGVLATRGRTTEVYPEAALTFRLMEPITVATERGSAAFRAVNQQDYEPRLDQRPPVRMTQRVPLYLGLGYGYGFPYYYSPFMYGSSFGYFGGSPYYSRGSYWGGHRGHGGRRR